jgi:hypothetical protein
MANYTKLTDFASKDALPTGNAAKIVKGTEIDDEFEALETAVATKSDIASPAFTGVPTAPTAAAGTNTTQLATTAHVFAERSNAVTLTNKTVNLTSNTLTGTTAQFNTALSDDNFATLTNTVTLTNKTLTSPTISDADLTGTPTAPTAVTTTNTTQLATTAFVQQEIAAIPVVDLSSVYPVGSVYINAAVSTNPGTLLGFGTWAAFGAGRVLVGLDAGDVDFDTVEETGGAKTHTLTVNEIPAHTHSVPNSGAQNNSFDSGTTVGNDVTGTSGSTGGGAAHNNLQPYIVVYMWKRTA